MAYLSCWPPFHYQTDALSRQQEETASLSAISYAHLDWLDRMKAELKQDPWIQAKIGKLQHDHFLAKHYSVQDGLLQYDNRLVISPESPWRTVILDELYASPAAGHSSYLKNSAAGKQNFLLAPYATRHPHTHCGV
jgi:hypothetical protein